MERLWQDVRFGWRALRKSPGYMTTATITLALGIGLNTAMFSLIHAVLLKPLPFPSPELLEKADAYDLKSGPLAQFQRVALPAPTKRGSSSRVGSVEIKSGKPMTQEARLEPRAT